MNAQILEELIKIDQKNAHLLLDIAPSIKEGILLKGDTFIKEGSFINKVGYVLEGNLISIKHTNNKDVVCNFHTTGSWIGNIDGYNDGKNSASIVSVGISKVAWIETVVLKREFLKEPKLKNFELKFFTKVICSTTGQLIDFKSLAPIDRYQKLITERPELIKNFSNYHIASYLGVSPETLSRIKNRSNTAF